jgi:hypothetical protein
MNHSNKSGKPAQPVVCLDEKPISLHADVRPPMPAKPGKPAKQDNEYQRCGTANIFGVVEPKGGRHFTTATPNRSGAEFSRMVGASWNSTPPLTRSTSSSTTSISTAANR